MLTHSAHFTRPASHPLTSRFILALLLVLMILPGACSAKPVPNTALAGGSVLTLSALPAGVGRGFPSADVARAANSKSGLQEGQAAPNFHLVLADGRTLSLHALRGQPVLINFWATWCGPCRLEMPEIVNLAATNADLVVLAVNVQESIEQMQPFAEDFQMVLPIVRDTDGALRDLYEVRGMPTSVLIDREGKIFTIWAGMLTNKLLQEMIEEMG